MADIFHEVDEEVRRERLKKLWDRYGTHALALAVLLVVGIGGWRGYDYWQNQKAAEAGARFEAALRLSDEGKQQEAEAAFVKLAADGTAGYRTLARLRAAAAERDKKAAVAAYDAIASDAGVAAVFQDLAAVRAAALLVDSAPYAEMQRRLEPLTAAQRTFRHSARELLALSAWRAGDAQATKRWSDMIVTDIETPAGMRARVEVLLALSAGKG